MGKGRFYCFDGIDGAGSETQSKMLAKLLDQKGIPYLLLDYPDYSNPIGNFINNYLHSSDHIPVGVKLVLYTADMLKDKEAIEQALSEGKMVIACRYVTTALAYQVVEGFDSGKAMDYVRLMGFPVPDVAVYLKISPDTSAKRKMKEKGRLDRNESDLQLLAKVAARYDDMASKNVFCEWETINGEQSTEKVFENARKILGL